MINKIKVHPFVGKGMTYLVMHNKNTHDLHMALTTKFSHEAGSNVSISYIEQWAVNEVPMSEVGKIDSVLVLE